jgi:hypothetical protein
LCVLPAAGLLLLSTKWRFAAGALVLSSIRPIHSPSLCNFSASLTPAASMRLWSWRGERRGGKGWQNGEREKERRWRDAERRS